MRPGVVLNALALRPGGAGVSTYIRELLTALVRLELNLSAVVQADAAALLPAGVTTRERPVCAGARRALEGLRSYGPAALVHGLDVDIPLRPGAPTVVTVHDCSVFDVPWAHGRVRAAGERGLVRRAVRAADEVIAVSSFTAERVEALFGRRSTVVLEAAPSWCRRVAADEVDAIRGRWDLPDRFVLHVGTVEPRKDVPALAAACDRAGLPLVLVGARASAVPAGSRALGYVPGEHLPALYGAATVVAYPSRYEGFGLPPLEAMACGAPVVASAATSMPEVLGDAALLVPPGDAVALAEALRQVATEPDLRADLVARGGRRSRELSWDAAARGTWQVYERLGVSAGS